MSDPDEAQQAEEPPRQRSTQPSARAMAQTLTDQLVEVQGDLARLDRIVGGYEADHVRETVATHRNTIDALRQELDGYQNAINRQLDKLRDSVAAVGPIMQGAADTMAGTGLEHIQDLQADLDRTGTAISGVLARLDALERRTASVEAAGGTVDMDPLLDRLDKLEGLTGELAGRGVEAHNDQLSTRLNAVERRLSTVGALPDVVGIERGPIKFTASDALSAEVADEVAHQIQPLVKNRAAFEQDLLARLENLERQLPQWSRLDKPPVGGVHAKVLELMRKVNAIGKDRQADQGAGGRFKFRGIDEAMDAVGHAMREVGLTLETEMLDKDYGHNPVTKTYMDRGEERTSTVLWTTATVTYRYIFVDPTDGSRHVFEMAGEGRDASDKATSKAGSMALKYGLFQALMIPVTGMDDGDTESPQVNQDRATQRPPAQGSGDARQAPQGQLPPQRKPPEKSKAERALDAVAAIRNINRWPAEERLNVLVAISSRVEQEGLSNIEVEGATVRAHLVATQNTLAPAPEPPDDQPPF
jgi:ERF superfamily protein